MCHIENLDTPPVFFLYQKKIPVILWTVNQSILEGEMRAGFCSGAGIKLISGSKDRLVLDFVYLWGL